MPTWRWQHTVKNSCSELHLSCEFGCTNGRHRSNPAAAVFYSQRKTDNGKRNDITIRDDKGFGFIHADGTDYFFHASDLIDLDFDEQLKERRVTFNVTTTPKGLRARNIQAAG